MLLHEDSKQALMNNSGADPDWEERRGSVGKPRCRDRDLEHDLEGRRLRT